MKHFIHYFSKHYLPSWIVLLLDLTIALISWFFAYIIRFNFDMSQIEISESMLNLIVIFPILIFHFYRLKSYSGILRHTTIKDITRIISAIALTGLILTIISLIGRLLHLPSFLILPISVIIIFVLLVSIFLSLSRIFAKILFQFWNHTNKVPQRIMIYGAGELGQTTYNTLLLDSSVNISLVGFIDNNRSLQNKYISGIPIYQEKRAFNEIIPKKKVSEIIFATERTDITYKHKRKIADICIKLGIVIKEVPPVKTWINGELRAAAIQRIKIEDLLGRNLIQLDKQLISRGLKDSIVLITGAAGSIGSEIVRQLINFKVRKVVLLDKAESDLYNLQQEIIADHINTDFEVIVGDVTNSVKMRKIFEQFSPSIVFSAAAYKHVPLMEEFPSEAFHVNVGGNKILADLSAEFGVKKFVLISTDKAVNPTNVMGTTKRISEMYIQALSQSGKYTTQFITTRFGNVLGSNGSVVPLFKKQIEKGGPVTLTHKKITRYFMTIPEACQLVLEAGFMGKGGEIFVFDMGQPIRILDLAKKMISLSGFIPNRDIKIKVTGLRPGEKLYEELFDNKSQKLLQTHNDKIMIGKDRKHDLFSVNKNIIDILQNINNISRNDLIEQLMRIVPEYVPKNSYFKQKEFDHFMNFSPKNGKDKNKGLPYSNTIKLRYNPIKPISNKHKK